MVGAENIGKHPIPKHQAGGIDSARQDAQYRAGGFELMSTALGSVTDTSLDADLTSASVDSEEQSAAAMVENVAHVVSGVSLIGVARDALRAAGHVATIAANRITIDDTVEAQFIPAEVGTYGLSDARWIVSPVAVATPVWVVGAERTRVP